MGKRVGESRGEVVGIASDIFRYYADNGPHLLADDVITIRAARRRSSSAPWVP